MTTSTPGRWRKQAVALSLVATGLVGGGVLASTVAASAADSAASPGATATAQATVDQSRSQRADEHLLTGADAEKATAAALAKYPGATIQRVETDSDGVYEAHLTTSAGERLIVQMDASFAVTGTDTGGGHGGAGRTAGY